MRKSNLLHVARWLAVAVACGSWALVGVSPQTASAQLVQGQWLQLNFTDGWPFPPDQPGFDYNEFNYFQLENSGFNGTTGSTALIDSLGNLVPNVTLTARGWQGKNWDPGSNADAWPPIDDPVDVPNSAPPTPANLAGRGDSTIRRDESINFWWDASIDTPPVVIVEGLDPNLAYNIYYYSKHSSTSIGESHTLDVNGILQTTAPRATRYDDPDEDLFFSQILTNANGELVFTWGADPASPAGFNPVLNAIFIQAVIPEPATVGLLMGGVALLGAVKLRRKR